MTPEEVRAIVREEHSLITLPQCKERHMAALKTAEAAAGAAARAHDRANEVRTLAEKNENKLLQITNEAKGGILDVLRIQFSALSQNFVEFKARYDADRWRLAIIAAVIVIAIILAPDQDLRSWVKHHLGME